jgi:flavin-dependent dehydrogenase
MAGNAREGYAAEVIVVGAGPAGSAAATLLAGLGCEVLLLDRCHFPRDKPCGEFVNPAGAAMLRELGVLDALPAAWRSLRGLLLRGPDGDEVSLEYPGDPPPRAISVRRSDLDTALVERAVAAGARFASGIQVDDLIWEGGRVAGVFCRGGAGAQRRLGARLVIAADGAQSRLCRRAGLHRDSGERRIALVGHFRDVAADLNLVEMHALGWGYCGFALTSPGNATAAMVVRQSELPALQGRAAEFFAERLRCFSHIHARVRDAEQVGAPQITGPVSIRAARAALPGLLLTGDAAGFFDPFTGRGITRALRAAHLAAEAAERLLGGAPDRHVLKQYEAGYRAIDGAHLVERAIRFVIDHPPLLRHAVRCFRESPELGRLLLGVAGDLLPGSAVLNAAYLARLLGPPTHCFPALRGPRHWLDAHVRQEPCEPGH